MAKLVLTMRHVFFLFTFSLSIIAQSQITTNLSSVSPSLNGTIVASATQNVSIPLSTSVTIPTTTVADGAAVNETIADQGSDQKPPFLDTKIDAPFGVLGAILILSGLPMLFIGGKNRWTSYFFTGFYAFSLISLVLILRFGVQNQVKDPSVTTRGLFLFACIVAGVVGGASAILFFKAARPAIGALGSFTLSLLILTLRNNVLIRPIALRYVLIIALTAIGFVLCTVTKLQPYVIVVSTSVIGATAVVLGIDCFTTRNLKEYYIYILGFYKVFPQRIRSKPFNVSDAMQIEIGVLAALIICGIASQARIFRLLQEKVAKIEDEHRERREAEDAAAKDLEARKIEDLARWEEKYNSKRRGSSAQSLLWTPPSLLAQGTPQDTSTSFESRELDFRPRVESKRSSVLVPLHSTTDVVTTIGTNIDSHPELLAKKQELEEIARIRNEISRLRQGFGSGSTPNIQSSVTDLPVIPPPALTPSAIRSDRTTLDLMSHLRSRSLGSDQIIEHQDLYVPPQINQENNRDFLPRKVTLDGQLTLVRNDKVLKGDSTRRHSSGAVLQAVLDEDRPVLDIEELKNRHKQHIRALQSSVTAKLKEQHQQATIKRTVEKMKQELLDKERQNASDPDRVRWKNEAIREESRRRSTSKVLDWQEGKTSSVAVKATTSTNDQNGWLDY